MTRTLRAVLVEHPVAWGAFALAVFPYISRLPVNGWNVEMLIARNLLRGHGFVVGPLDPPALWRPPLAVLALVPIEAVVEEPTLVYRMFGTVCLTTATLTMFYLMKMIGGISAAHFSQLAAFTFPPFITFAHQQLTMLAYLVMLATVLAALFFSISAWQTRSRRADMRAGLTWGLAFLARPELSALFGASLVCSFLVYRRECQGATRHWQKLIVQAASFLLIYSLAYASFRHAQQKYDLIGQLPLLTYYTGEHFASNTPAVDRDGEGYAETVRRYGEPAVYDYSLARFAWAQPAAVLTRIRQNIGNTLDLFASGHVVYLPHWLVLVGFGALLARSTPPPVPGWYLLLYGALLSAGSTHFLLFHPDPRYLLAFVLMLFVTLQIAAILLWQRIGRIWPRTIINQAIIIACTIALVGVAGVSVRDAVYAATNAEIYIPPFRALADRFRASVGPEGTPALGFLPPDSDAMWISYFADTAIPWHVNSAMFPRDRMYSFVNRAEEYMLAPAWTNLADLDNPPVLWRIFLPRLGEYVCLDLRAARDRAK